MNRKTERERERKGEIWPQFRGISFECKDVAGHIVVGDFRNSNILARTQEIRLDLRARTTFHPSLKRSSRGRKRALVIVERRRIVFWWNGDWWLTNSNSDFYGRGGRGGAYVHHASWRRKSVLRDTVKECKLDV